MTLLHKEEKSFPTQMDFYNLYMVTHTISWGNHNFERSTNKISFLMNFPHLEKFANLIKDLKYEHQSIFPLWWRVKLNFRDRYRKPNLFSKNSRHCQVFSPNCWKMTLLHKEEKSLPTQIDFYNLYMVTHTISWGNYNFERSTNKIPFLTNFPHLEKFANLIKDLKYEHQSIFPLWWRVKLNFRDRYRKPNNFSKNSNCYQVFSPNCQKMTFWCKKKSLPTQVDLYNPYMVPNTISLGNYNFPRSTNKISIFDEISTSGKVC